MRVIGLDIGFGQVKMITKEGKLKFPSQIAQYIPDSVSDVEYVEHNSMLYVVGDACKCALGKSFPCLLWRILSNTHLSFLNTLLRR